MGILTALASTVCLAVLVGIIIAIGIIATDASPEAANVALIVGNILVVGYAVFTQLAVTVKRCHDRGRSGWWCLLTLIPFVGLAWLVLYLGVPNSTAVAAIAPPETA